MRKLSLVFTGLIVLAFLGTTVLAADPIRLFVNGREIVPDVAPRLIDGRTMVPVRALAEALGARVTWDGATSTVSVTLPELAELQHQKEVTEQALEKVVAPRTPEEAASLWAEGVKQRNGVLQYVVMSTTLREQYRPVFEGYNWVTGVSSPWVESYRVEKTSESPDGVYTFNVTFAMKTSTGWAGPDITRVEVAKQPDKDGKEEWCVTGLYAPREIDFPQPGTGASVPRISMPLPTYWLLTYQKGEYTLYDTEANTIGAIYLLGGPYLPNHSRVLTEKEVSSGLGRAKLYLLERSEPAASGNTNSWQEMHLLLPVDDNHWLDMWVKVAAAVPLDATQLQAVMEKMAAGAQREAP